MTLSIKSRSLAGVCILVVIAVLALACGDSSDPTPEAPIAPTAPAPSVTSATAPAPAPTFAPPPRVVRVPTPVLPLGYDPRATMYQLYSGPGHQTAATLEGLSRALEFEDTSQVPVIIELLQFLRPDTQSLAAGVLVELTGLDFGGNLLRLREWAGENASQYAPPEGYVQWKIALFSLIHPRFADFLGPAAEATRIDMTELVWGGVAPDGIPPLENAPVIPAAEAEYLLPDDRVFGVSINGEHRAYPLRIIDAHEMANDVLGGEPISLAY